MLRLTIETRMRKQIYAVRFDTSIHLRSAKYRQQVVLASIMQCSLTVNAVQNDFLRSDNKPPESLIRRGCLSDHRHFVTTTDMLVRDARERPACTAYVGTSNCTKERIQVFDQTMRSLWSLLIYILYMMKQWRIRDVFYFFANLDMNSHARSALSASRHEGPRIRLINHSVKKNNDSFVA